MGCFLSAQSVYVSLFPPCAAAVGTQHFDIHSNSDSVAGDVDPSCWFGLDSGAIQGSDGFESLRVAADSIDSGNCGNIGRGNGRADDRLDDDHSCCSEACGVTMECDDCMRLEALLGAVTNGAGHEMDAQLDLTDAVRDSSVVPSVAVGAGAADEGGCSSELYCYSISTAVVLTDALDIKCCNVIRKFGP